MDGIVEVQLAVTKTRLACLELAEVQGEGGQVIDGSEASGCPFEVDGDIGPNLSACPNGRRGILILFPVPGASRFPELGQISTTHLNFPVENRPIEQGFAQDFRTRRSGLGRESRPAEEQDDPKQRLEEVAHRGISRDGHLGIRVGS